MFLGWIVRPSQSTKQLRDNNPELRDLAGWYRGFAYKTKLETLAFYETKRQLLSLVVTPCSADPGLAADVFEPIGQNHVGICKLAAPVEHAPLFGRMKNLIEKVHKDVERGKTYVNFEERLQFHMQQALADPDLAILKDELGYTDAEGIPRIRIPAKFRDIRVAENLRVMFEEGLRKSIREGIDNGSLTLSDADIVAAERSHFDSDKYVLDLWRERSLAKGFKAMRERFQDEVKKIKKNGTSLIPLYRPVRAIEHAIEDDLPHLLHAIRDVIPEIEKRPALDGGRETRDLLERLGKSLEAYRKTCDELRQIHRTRREARSGSGQS
jgi:hypothetical protein